MTQDFCTECYVVIVSDDQRKNCFDYNHQIIKVNDEKDIEKANKGPFTFTGFDWSLGGRITSWKKGKLAQSLPLSKISLTLELPQKHKISAKKMATITGDVEVSSDNKIFRRGQPSISYITLNFF